METLFLSYTYKPHPDFEDATYDLVGRVRSVSEMLGIKVITGEDVGGDTLSDAIRQRIGDSDALVGVETPWQRLESGSYIASDWVRREFSHAVDLGKPAIALVHKQVVPNAAFTDKERIVFDPADSAAALVKLMRTISQWRRDKGRSLEIELGPPNVSDRLSDENPDHLCQYRIMREHETTDWRSAKFWHDVGGALAYLREIPEDAKIQVRVQLGNEKWHSSFRSPMRRVELKKEDQ